MIKNVMLIAGCGFAILVAIGSVNRYSKQRKKTMQMRKRLENVEAVYALDMVKREIEELERNGDSFEIETRKLLRRVDRELGRM